MSKYNRKHTWQFRAEKPEGGVVTTLCRSVEQPELFRTQTPRTSSAGWVSTRYTLKGAQTKGGVQVWVNTLAELENLPALIAQANLHEEYVRLQAVDSEAAMAFWDANLRSG